MRGRRKGTPKTGGRKKGVPNRVTGELKDMILKALNDAGGVEYLKDRALDTPGPFLALVGKVLPLQVNGAGKQGEHVFRIENPWLSQVLAQRGLE